MRITDKKGQHSFENLLSGEILDLDHTNSPVPWHLCQVSGMGTGTGTELVAKTVRDGETKTRLS